MVAIALIASLVLVSCSEKKNSSQVQSEQQVTTQKETAEKPIIAVSIVPEQTFVQKVCGDDYEVVTIIPPGYSPESYDPTPLEAEKFNKAKIYFTIGVPAEENILKRISSDTKIVHLEDIVSKAYEDRHFGDTRDPHIWLSPKRVKVMVNTIAENLVILKEGSADYMENANQYIEELSQLEVDITQLLLPVKSMSFVVFHPAFGYFADEFGLKMYALEEEGHDATPKNLMNLVDFAKENGIKTIFYQDEIDSAQSKSFAEEIGGISVPLSPLSADYTANLLKMAKTIKDSQVTN
ncbi:MAG: hypothetical protein BKP49_05945 [Treponema sp. CETP13]|nr:MAG: hypothetical protein BKP49_05945 [Treponema sp. CETP13]